MTLSIPAEEMLAKIEAINRLREIGGNVREHMEAQRYFDEIKASLLEAMKPDEIQKDG